MHRSIRSILPARTARVAVLAAVAAAAVLVLTVPGLAGALKGSVPPPPTNPTSADQIQNIDQVKTAIKGYYGDTVTGQVDPVPNTIDGGDVVLHTFSPTGAYANEVGGIVQDAEKFLAKPKATHGPGVKAVLFDVDDTTLNTYNYEIYSNFVFNPTTNNAFADAAAFPAVPHMVDLEHFAESLGYQVFFLTGRRDPRRPGTITNLTGQGYDLQDDHLYTRPLSDAAPWLSSCAPTCTTTQYKSLTREHIESLGFDIVANFGDQFSDLNGGFADETFKLPNPTYFLP